MPTKTTMTTPTTPVETPSDPTPRPVRTGWHPDILEGYEQRDLVVDAEPVAGEPVGPLVATLVRRVGRPRRRAVLYVHGWNDYFFHTHVADWFDARGFTLYAIDLRRCGRSFREGQLLGYIDSLHDYFDELDAALAVIEAEHEACVVVAHSTGGLTAALWADARPGRLAGLVLNSPWLDVWGPQGLATAVRPLLGTASRRNPYSIIPLPEGQPIYAHALHRDWGGEWDYSLTLKSATAVPIRVGWLRAVLRGQASVSKGLAVDCPIFVATSTTSWFGRRYRDKAKSNDIVLDVSRITAQAWHLGRLVTVARIPGAVHDVFLSSPAARRRVFADLEAWLKAFVT